MLYEKGEKIIKKTNQTILPVIDLFEFDQTLFSEGYTTICGIDEAGRGPLAGPVVAAAVVMEKDIRLPGVMDSKKLKAEKREELFQMITEKAAAYGVGIVEPGIIDRINILAATHLAARKALEQIPAHPDLIITDFLKLKKCPAPLRYYIKGDNRSQAIAAASIIAKVTRDRMMMEYHEKYPQYNFAAHKGYGTAKHLKALREHGPCPIHRITFKGVIPQGFL